MFRPAVLFNESDEIARRKANKEVNLYEVQDSEREKDQSCYVYI